MTQSPEGEVGTTRNRGEGGGIRKAQRLDKWNAAILECWEKMRRENLIIIPIGICVLSVSAVRILIWTRANRGEMKEKAESIRRGLLSPYQTAEKVIFSRLLKKGQMQGSRNPEE